MHSTYRMPKRHCLFLVFVAASLVGCASKKSIQVDSSLTPSEGASDEAAAPQDLCPDQEETTNGYRDEDGCPDDLARLGLLILDPSGTPLAGVTAMFPGASQPLVTGDDGWIRAFELFPVKATSIEVTAPDGYASQTIDLELAEGSQELTVTLERKTTSPTPQPDE